AGAFPAHPGQEVDAVEELHREAPGVGALEQLAELHQVGMAHALDQPELALQIGEEARLTARERLEREAPAGRVIVGLVDHAHAASTELAQQREPIGPLGGAESASAGIPIAGPFTHHEVILAETRSFVLDLISYLVFQISCGVRGRSPRELRTPRR